MAIDLSRVRGLCFDVDGTIADTDDHLVAQLAALIDKLPLVSGRRAERVARQVVMASETPVNGAYGLLDRFGLDVSMSRMRERVRTARERGADPAHTRNGDAVDQIPHDMMAGVKEMLEALAKLYPLTTISTGSVLRVERFLEHYGVRQLFRAVVGSQTTPRMKPHPDPLFHAANAMGVAPAACLMIGDTTVDMRCGAAAGAQTVGVLCGFGTEAELSREGAGLILRTTSDLLAVLAPAQDALGKTASPEPAAS